MVNKYNVNRQIKAQKINLVLPNGEMNKAITLPQALTIAEEQGLDVVEVSKQNKDGVSICKVLDYGKMLYQQDKKKKGQKHINHIKEIRYGFNIT